MKIPVYGHIPKPLVVNVDNVGRNRILTDKQIIKALVRPIGEKRGRTTKGTINPQSVKDALKEVSHHKL